MNFRTANLSRRAALLCGATGALVAMPNLSWAQESYPSRPIRFFVPFGAGSSSDIMARAYANVVGTLANQPVIVEDRAGGDGIVGARAVLAQPADGYSIMFASNSSLSTNVVVHKDLPYDPLKDFDPISVLQVSYAAVAVPASSKFQTFDQLVTFANKNRGELTHASGSPTYTLWNAWLTKILGIEATNIPYKDSGAAAQAVAGGQVDYAVTAVTPMLPLVQGGRIRILLYTGKQRHSQLPNVPSVKEAGINDYEALIWNAVAVRAGTSKVIRHQITEMFERATHSEELLIRTKVQGYVPAFSGPEEMHKFQMAEISRWKKLVADTGLKFE
jgi:tripartite-type tricarboxylate transporter receptor subunit TctC